METSFLPLMEATPVTSAAAGRVLSVGELIEMVLLHLPEQDVVRCRRVSKKFQETVTYSKSIRQMLYLEADASMDRRVNPLAPAWFGHRQSGYRDTTIAAKIDVVDMWAKSQLDVRPLWDNMLISQPPATTCVIPIGNHLTIYPRRYYPQGMTFGDLEKAVIAAFEIRKGRRSSKERLEDLSLETKFNSVLIYWS